MSRIDFAFGAPDRLRMACEVIHRHYLADRRLIVYFDDDQTLERFDLLLWGFDRTAFVPHVPVDDPLAARTPVQLTSSQPEALLTADSQEIPWLVNLGSACVPNANSFDRILEIVSGDQDDRLAGRERWRQYKAQGHELRAHDLAARPSQRQ